MALRLYPIFKEEVYRRRDHMMRWTAIGAGSLVAILCLILLTPAAHSLTTASRLLLACATFLQALAYMGIILQQHARHQQAKQQLIKIEQTLGLFGESTRTANDTFYPDAWKTDWTRDRSLLQYMTILSLLTGITLVAILLPNL
ncbi:MAG: hypothetical protein IT389_04170 [Nitrospira sp.]|nr:hypothetical protein [Nitrospira sp.]